MVILAQDNGNDEYVEIYLARWDGETAQAHIRFEFAFSETFGVLIHR